MCVAASRYGPVHYRGYDVFETEPREFHLAAMNGKGIPPKRAAEAVLHSIAGLTFELIEGDTRATLHGQRVAADLVFIDGDHRSEMVRLDYEAFDARCIVFDDYLSRGLGGEIPYMGYGANAVVDELGAELLPIKDRTARGWMTQMAVLRF